MLTKCYFYAKQSQLRWLKVIDHDLNDLYPDYFDRSISDINKEKLAEHCHCHHSREGSINISVDLRFLRTHPWLGHGHIIHWRGLTGWILNLGEVSLTPFHFTVPCGTLFSSDRHSHLEQIKLMC